MDPSIYSGLFAIAGAAVGGGCSVAATFIERRWGRARRDIRILADQVAAYYQLERLYKDEMAGLTGKAPKTIMEQMRTRVEENGAYVRPTMTSNEAARIQAKWKAD
jgi:hypothetical protein